MTTIIAAENRIAATPDATPSTSGAAGRFAGGEGAAAALLTTAWLLGRDRAGWSIEAVLAAVAPIALSLFALMAGSRGTRRGRAMSATGRVLFAGLVLVSAASALEPWEERGTGFAAVASLTSAALNLLGYRATSERGLLQLDHPEGMVELAPTSEKFATVPFLLFAAAWFALEVANDGRRASRWRVAMAITILVALARFVVALLIYLENDQILVGDGGLAALDFVGSSWTIVPSLLVAGWAIDRAARRGAHMPTPARAGRRPREVAAVAVAMLGAGGLVGLSWTFEPPGPEKPGRVLIDDRFCGIWEPTARRLDTEWYGDFSTYSFTSLAEWLGKWFAVDANIGRAYDDDLLSRYDVLIIKTPEEAIPAREAEAIDRFVRRGGGLLLVGDHTNLLGMGTNLNALSARYGIRFRYDSVSDGATGGFVDYLGPAVGRPVGALHVDHLQFMTSCSLQLSGSAEAVLAADGCRREPHDYAAPSFFGRRGPHPEMEHGRTVLAATVRVGRGRIAAFTDSTVWSSFGVFEFDREKLAMDLIRLLNRDPSPYTLPLRVASGLALALAATLVIVSARSGLVATALFFGLSAFWSGVAMAEVIHRQVYAWPAPNSPVDEVAFLWQGGACAFPPVLGTPDSLAPNVCFDTLLVSVERLGLVPRVAHTYEAALRRPETRAVVVVAPVDIPPVDVIERLRAFVLDGGHVVVVDNLNYGGRGSAKEFLSAFGATIEYHGTGHGAEAGRPHVHLGGGMEAFPVPAPDALAARKPFGRGQVVYLSDAAGFSREGLGHCFSRPWKSSRARYETIFHLFRDVLAIAPQERRFYGILE